MLKLEVNELMIIYQMMEQAQIQGKDAVLFGKLITKVQKELEKLAPNTLVNNG